VYDVASGMSGGHISFKQEKKKPFILKGGFEKIIS
jgi:hypothetical protein